MRKNDFSDEHMQGRPPFAKHIKPKPNKKYMKGKQSSVPDEEVSVPVNEEE